MAHTLTIKDVPNFKVPRVEAEFRAYGARVQVKANRDGHTSTVAAKFLRERRDRVRAEVSSSPPSG